MTKISKKRPWLTHLCTKLGNYTEDKGCVGRQNRKKEMDKDRDRGRGRELTNGTWDLSEQRRRRRRRRPLFPTFAKKIPISDFDFCAKKRRIFWHFCFFIPDLTQSELVELFPSLYPSLPLYLSVFSLFANSSYLYNLYFSLSLSLSCFPPPIANDVYFTQCDRSSTLSLSCILILSLSCSCGSIFLSSICNHLFS